MDGGMGGEGREGERRNIGEGWMRKRGEESTMNKIGWRREKDELRKGEEESRMNKKE